MFGSKEASEDKLKKMVEKGKWDKLRKQYLDSDKTTQVALAKACAASRLGAKTAELILQKKYGYMTCVKENKIDIIPISEVAGKTKLVDTDSDIIRQAKFAGLSFGDEPCGI